MRRFRTSNLRLLLLLDQLLLLRRRPDVLRMGGEVSLFGRKRRRDSSGRRSHAGSAGFGIQSAAASLVGVGVARMRWMGIARRRRIIEGRTHLVVNTRRVVRSPTVVSERRRRIDAVAARCYGNAAAVDRWRVMFRRSVPTVATGTVRRHVIRTHFCVNARAK